MTTIKYSVNKEIIDLWIEIHYLRLVLNEILMKNPSISEGLSPDMFQPIRDKAIRLVGQKFSVIEPKLQESID